MQQSAKQETIDFMSPDECEGTPTCLNQSAESLVHNFPFLDRGKAKAILASSSSRYAIAHDKVCQAILTKTDTDNERHHHELLLFLLLEQQVD